MVQIRQYCNPSTFNCVLSHHNPQQRRAQSYAKSTVYKTSACTAPKTVWSRSGICLMILFAWPYLYFCFIALLCCRSIDALTHKNPTRRRFLWLCQALISVGSSTVPALTPWSLWLWPPVVPPSGHGSPTKVPLDECEGELCSGFSCKLVVGT